MLIKFKCKASPDLIMLEQHVKPFIDSLNNYLKVSKEVVRGVITKEETAGVIRLLEGEIAKTVHEKSAEVLHDVLAHHGENGDEPGHDVIEPVTYSARMRPLLNMLKKAQKAGEFVVWEPK